MTDTRSRTRGRQRPRCGFAVAGVIVGVLAVSSCTDDDPSGAPTPAERTQDRSSATPTHLPQHSISGVVTVGGKQNDIVFTLNQSGCLLWDNRVAVFPQGTTTGGTPGTLTLPDGSELEWETEATISYLEVDLAKEPEIAAEAAPCVEDTDTQRALLVLPPN